MSKWTTKFEKDYKNTTILKKLTKEIKDAKKKREAQLLVDKNISGVIKGKYVRRGF